MQWSEVRRTYPNQWLMIEALEAETQADSRRHLKRLAVIEQCADSAQAFQCYRQLHQQYPGRGFYFRAYQSRASGYSRAELGWDSEPFGAAG